jgi:hypothetical protein
VAGGGAARLGATNKSVVIPRKRARAAKRERRESMEAHMITAGVLVCSKGRDEL